MDHLPLMLSPNLNPVVIAQRLVSTIAAVARLQLDALDRVTPEIEKAKLREIILLAEELGREVTEFLDMVRSQARRPQ